MKTLCSILLVAVASVALAKTPTPSPKPKPSATVAAKPSPTPGPTVEVIKATPTPTPVPPLTALNPSAQQLADVRAVQVIGQVNAFAANMRRALDEGVPARGRQPGLTAEQLKSALGTANVARIEAALKALK